MILLLIWKKKKGILGVVSEIGSMKLIMRSKNNLLETVEGMKRQRTEEDITVGFANVGDESTQVQSIGFTGRSSKIQ